MTDLVACLGNTTAGWTYVKELMQRQDWQRIFVVASVEAAESFSPPRPCQFIVIDSRQKLPQLVAHVQKQLSGKLQPLDVALNLSAGTGKECMAVVAALLKLGAGIRLVAYTEEGGVQEI